MMDSHVFRKMAWRLPSLANIAVLRFNSRGTTSLAGTSEGQFDFAVKEGLDLQAAIEFCVAKNLPNIWVIGWSFGTDVILKNLRDQPVDGVILLSPPLRYTSEDELAHWNESGYKVHALIPEFDDFLPPEQAVHRFAGAADVQLEPVAKAKHLWVGEKFVYFVLNRVVELITPAYAPLPTEWDGPMDKWNDLNNP
jgi:alpha/beta superfamily hydrolase